MTRPANNEWWIYSIVYDHTNSHIYVNSTKVHSESHTTLFR